MGRINSDVDFFVEFIRVYICIYIYIYTGDDGIHLLRLQPATPSSHGAVVRSDPVSRCENRRLARVTPLHWHGPLDGLCVCLCVCVCVCGVWVWVCVGV
jgi:hypothetical protein